MDKVKIFLANAVAVLAAASFGYVCFLGRYFDDPSIDMLKYIVEAALIALVFGGLAISLGVLKRTNDNFAVYLTWEIIFLISFAALAVFFAITPFPQQYSSPFPQYFAISQHKNEILQIFETSAGENDDYGSLQLQQIQNSIKRMPLPIRPSSVVDITNYVEQHTDLQYKLSSVNVNNPGKPTPFSIVAAILLYALMLAPYLFSRRSEKPKILRRARSSDDDYEPIKDTQIDI